MKRFQLLLIALPIFLVACAQVPTYQDPEANSFSIQPPQGWIAHRSKELTYPDATMQGVSFVAPSSVGSGTVLLEVSIDVATGEAAACPQTGSAATLDGVQAKRWEWNDAGAGNLYQGTTVAAMHAGKCYRVTLFNHNCNIGPDCMKGHTAPFDRKTLLPLFEQSLSTFRFSN